MTEPSRQLAPWTLSPQINTPISPLGGMERERIGPSYDGRPFANVSFRQFEMEDGFRFAVISETLEWVAACDDAYGRYSRVIAVPER